MAKKKSKRSKASRVYRGIKAAAKKYRRKRSSSGTRALGGFLALPARPVDLALGGAGVLAAGYLLPMAVSKIPIRQIQSGYGNAVATSVIGAALGGLIAKYGNRSAGLGLSLGAIGSGIATAIATARGGGGLSGYMPGSEFAYPALNGYMPNNPAFDMSLSGYVPAG